MRLAAAIAGGRDVRIGGGSPTVRDVRAAALIDTMRIIVRPVTLGHAARYDLPLMLTILGAGKPGTTAAHLAADHDEPVSVATSRAPEHNALILEVLAPGGARGDRRRGRLVGRAGAPGDPAASGE